MLELWRRVVIGSAIVVYIAGLACAGSLLVGRIEAGAGLPSLAALVPDPPRTGRRDGEPAMRADDVIAAPASDAGAAGGLSAALSVLATLRADPRQAIQEDSICCLVCAGRVPPAHEYPPPRAWPERRRVQDPLRLQPRAAAHVSGARPHVCGPRPQHGAGGPDSPAPDPARARASAARRDAEHLARGALDPARDPAARGAATHGGLRPHRALGTRKGGARVGLGCWPWRAAPAPADRYVRGGLARSGVYTGEIYPANVRDQGRAHRLGRPAARRCIGPATDILDACGRTLVPGYIEPHAHPWTLTTPTAARPPRAAARHDDAAWPTTSRAATSAACPRVVGARAFAV